MSKKICHFCQESIKTKSDKYVQVCDWEKEERKNEIWSHLFCFKKAMNRDLKEAERIAIETLYKANDMLNKIAPTMETYEIK